LVLALATISSAAFATPPILKKQLVFGITLPEPSAIGLQSLKPYVCKAAPQLPYDVLIESAWNANFTAKDPAADKRAQEQVRPFNNVFWQLNRMVDQYSAGVPIMAGSHKTALDVNVSDCILSWMRTWALQDALAGKTSKHQGFAYREFWIGVLAYDYNVATRWRSVGSNKENAIIHTWMKKIVREHMDVQDGRVARGSSNNHLYWTAFAALNVGIATQDANIYNWGVEMTRKGINQINSRGFLEGETRRETLALNYHAFALDALMLNLQLINGTGDKSLNFWTGNLHKLANNVYRGLDNPKIFSDEVKRITGNNVTVQLPFGKLASAEILWTIVSPQNDKNVLKVAVRKYLKVNRPIIVTFPGPNITQLYQYHWVNGKPL
jgi:poly(beta-D-mannuronate) lyase